MAITLANLQIVKDLLLFTAQDVDLDALVTAEWDQQLAVLAREYDLFVYVGTLDTVAGKSVYTLPLVTTRVYSVMFRGTVLIYTDAGTLDLKDPDWELAMPGTPLYWSFNAVPPNADVPSATITPREILITPAPDGGQAGTQTLTVYAQDLGSLVPPWVEPLLVYRTAAHLAQENPNLMQPEKGEFFNSLAEMWLKIARQNLQV